MNRCTTTDLIRDAIAAHWERHGYAPTVREIQDAAGISSPSVVAYHLYLLERSGDIVRTPGLARTIRLVEVAS